MKRLCKIGFIGLALLYCAPSYAASSDSLIEGAKLCTQHLPRYEREYAIPTHLLSAIASTESGRYHEGLRLKLPWPWTISAGGKGYYYNSKEEAIAAVKKLRAHGVESIDVGCMQVNLYHHPDAFSSLDKAFEPETNIAYAAGFLRSLYDENGTWKKAAADYHSKTPKLGSGYVDMVYDSWFTIIERLREAKLHVPESAVTAMADMKGITNLSPTAGPKIINIKTTPLPEQEGRQVAAYTHPHMNTIQVTTNNEKSADTAVASHKENDILVFKPETLAVDSTPLQTPAPLTMAQYTPIADTAQKTAPATDDHAPAAVPAAQNRKSGPSFIFND